jgi:hypothetical protein
LAASAAKANEAEMRAATTNRILEDFMVFLFLVVGD